MFPQLEDVPRRILLERAKSRVDLQDRPIVGTDIYQNIINLCGLFSFIHIVNNFNISVHLTTFIYIYLRLFTFNLC